MGLTIAFLVAILIEIALPIVLAIWVIKHLKINLLIILIGMMTFMVVQVLQIPIHAWLSNFITLNQSVNLEFSWRPIFYGLVIGLSIAILTEVTRWGSYKFIKQIVKDYSHAVSLGIGYGVIETILLVGLPLVVSFITMIAYRNSDLNDLTLPDGLVKQVQALWQIPWHMPLIGAIERLASMITQITLSVVILQVFLRNNIKYLFYAIVWHTILESIPIIMSAYNINAWLIDLILVMFSILNLVLLARLGILKLLKEELTNNNKIIMREAKND